MERVKIKENKRQNFKEVNKNAIIGLYLEKVDIRIYFIVFL